MLLYIAKLGSLAHQFYRAFVMPGKQKPAT
jgi:hypothetical protein